MTINMSTPEFGGVIFVLLVTFSCQVHCQCTIFCLHCFPYISATSHIFSVVCVHIPQWTHDKTYKKTNEHLADTCPSMRPFKKKTYSHSKPQAQLCIKTLSSAVLWHSSRLSTYAGPLGSLPSLEGVIPSQKVSSSSFSALDFSGSSNMPSNLLFLSICLVCPGLLY